MWVIEFIEQGSDLIGSSCPSVPFHWLSKVVGSPPWLKDPTEECKFEYLEHFYLVVCQPLTSSFLTLKDY